MAWWLRAVEQATLRALELAGKRLVGSLSREHRHRDSPMRQVPAWEIHTQAALTTEQINRFLDGAYTSPGQLRLRRVCPGHDPGVLPGPSSVRCSAPA